MKDDALQEFFDEGFYVARGLFRPDEVAQMRAAFQRLFEIAMDFDQTTEHAGAQFVIREPGVVSRIVWAGGADPVLLDFGADPRLVDTACRLLDSDRVEQIINQAHYKMPGDNVAFRWHQDSENRGYGTSDWQDVNRKGSFVQTAIAVDAMTPENGPLQFVSRSHLKGHLGLDQLEDPATRIDPSQLITVELLPGDTAFFHPYAIHGSLPNHSQAPRRLFINGYAYPGANKRRYPGREAGRMLHAGRG